MLNLDSEDMGIVTVGCAGGGNTTIELPVNTGPVPKGAVRARVTVRGLRGGHSGVDIHEYRANAIKLLARVLWYARGTKFQLLTISGGDKHNAIPREAWAEVALAKADLPKLAGVALAQQAAALSEFGTRDPNIQIGVEVLGMAPAQALGPPSTSKSVMLLMALPHGVEKFSHDLPDLVETSTNLASAKLEGGALVVLHSTRSSIAPALEALRARIEAVALLAGAKAEHGEAYPGWKPDMASPLLGVTKAAHKDMFGADPEVEAIHAGLETGIVGVKFPGMDMVSIGPTLKNPHSPDECVDVRTVEQFWGWVVGLLERIAKKGVPAR